MYRLIACLRSKTDTYRFNIRRITCLLQIQRHVWGGQASLLQQMEIKLADLRMPLVRVGCIRTQCHSSSNPCQFGKKQKMLRNFRVAPKCPRRQMCNGLNEVGVQGDVEEQEDVEVDAGRQVNALLAPADCFPPIAAQRGRAAGPPSRRKALSQMQFCNWHFD